MATKKKLLQAAAGNAGGAALNVEDVFSTYLNNEGSSDQTITNGIDLAGEGGLVWGKSRNLADGFFLVDSARGKGSNNNFKYLRSDTTSQELDIASRSLSSMNSNGFTFQGADAQFNASGNEYVYWTFLKSKRFFDIQTWTGDGTVRNISHNLGSVPGMIIVKRTDGTGNWYVQHRSTGPTKSVFLDTTSAATTRPEWGNTTPTDSVFTVDGTTVTATNYSNFEYVAYLFAHNNGDGEFGPDGDADIIKCGSYTGNGSATGPTVNLGFEPQFLLVKNATGGNWVIADTMRSFGLEDMDSLYPNLSNAESTQIAGKGITPTATGFQCIDGNATTNQNAATHIYIAIRRPTAVPTSATEVFAISDRKNQIPSFPSGFPVDFLIGARTINSADNNEIKTRLISGGYLRANTTGAETVSDQTANFAHNDGFFNSSGANANQYCWMWKRAPNYFDVVAYTGNGTAGRTVSHNLGVAPEMMWVKQRNAAATWTVYHSGIGETKHVYLNDTSGAVTQTNVWNDTAPTDTAFTTGTYFAVNDNNDTYIAYLFATLAGISKVGSYTGTGAAQNIHCGFTSGARFILLKQTSGTGNWYVFDSVRGIVAGNDPYLYLNSTNAQVTSRDGVDPLSSGFALTTDATFNASGATYIFYAIA